MLNNIVQQIKLVDQFGASFQPILKQSLKEQKTVFGGLLSLLLYGLSLAYLLYDLTQWGSGQLLPKITTIQSRVQQQTFHFQEEIFVFSMMQSQGINPFDSEALIFVPLIIPFINYQIPNNTNFFDKTKIIINGTSVTIKNLSLQYGDQEGEQIVAFMECYKDIIPEGLQCANDSVKTAFFNQKSNSLVINTFISQFNTDKRKLEQINNEFSIALQNNSTYYQTSTFKIQESSVDTGILFSSLENYEYTTDYEVISQQIDQTFFRNQFQLNIFAAFKMRISKLKSFQSVQYSKISEVLADAGSIASALLVLAYFAISINRNLMDSQCLNEIIQIYYPEYKGFEIKKSLFGMIKQVKFEGRLQNIQQFEQYQRQLNKIAKKKLTTLNQIYEVSRLQFLLSSIINSKKTLENVHDKFIKIKTFDIYKEDDSLNQIIPIVHLGKATNSNPSGFLHQLCIGDLQNENPSNEPSQNFNLLDDGDFEILVKPEQS